MLEEYSVAPNDDEALLRWFVHGESFPDPLLMVDVSPLGDHADTTPEYLWYLKDALGSTGALANLAGEIVEGYVYTPYGETTILDEYNRPREVVAREAFFHDANFDGVIDGFDWGDLQAHLAAAEAGVFNPVALRIHDHNADGRLDAADEANFLAVWEPEDPAVAVPPQWRRPRGPVVDVLADGAYDVIDFLTFQTCLGRSAAGCVTLFDINKDAVVDITDYELYAHTWAGPDEPHGFARGSKYGNPFLWTGQRHEAETGLYHFVYRSYSPTLGRWLQRDPLGVVGITDVASVPPMPISAAPGIGPPDTIPGLEYSDSLDLFGYVNGRPTAGTDPLGSFFGGVVGALNNAYARAWIWASFTTAGVRTVNIVGGVLAAINLYVFAVDQQFRDAVVAQPDFTRLIAADIQLILRGGMGIRAFLSNPALVTRTTARGVSVMGVAEGVSASSAFTLDQALANPQLLSGLRPGDPRIQAIVAQAEARGWTVTSLGKGSNQGSGFRIHAQGVAGDGGKMIMFNPDGGHHGTYWKVSTPEGGTTRVFDP